MNPGDLVIFRAAHSSRRNLPVLRATVLGRPVETVDQIGALRIASGDSARIAEIRDDFALVKHERFKEGLCLVSLTQLDLATAAPQPQVPHEEDAKL